MPEHQAAGQKKQDRADQVRRDPGLDARQLTQGLMSWDLTSYLGSELPSGETIQRHAALLSGSAGAQRIAIARQLQQNYGNQYTRVLTRMIQAGRLQTKADIQRQSVSIIHRSPLSEQLEQLWLTQPKGVFFQRLRNLGVSDTDVHLFIEATLTGDDLWLARNLMLYGPETNWPVRLQVEREFKGWGGGGLNITRVLGLLNGATASDFTDALSALSNNQLEQLLNRASPSDRSTYAALIRRINDALQVRYGQIARTENPATLLAGTHTLTAAERAGIPAVLAPPRRMVGGVPAPFVSHRPGGVYEARIRAYLTARINSLYSNLVANRGPAEHADPSRVFPMTRYEEIGNAAKAETDAVFGSYLTGSHPAFSAGTNLFDAFEEEQAAQAALTPSQLTDKAKDLISYLIRSDDAVWAINSEHNAIITRTALSPGEPESEATIIDRIRTSFTDSPAKVQRLNDIDRGWEATAGGGVVNIQRWRASSDRKNRYNFWDAFQTMIHEYCHTLVHANYSSYARTFTGGYQSEEYDTLIEGMDSLLTEIVWNNVKGRVSTPALRIKVEGASYAAQPFDPLTIPDVAGQRYPSYNQAMRLVERVGIRNVYAAYFMGRTDLIGR